MAHSIPTTTITPDVLYRHNMGNLKLHYPQLYQIISAGSYTQKYTLASTIDREQPCRIENIHRDSPDRGENGIIHPAQPIEHAATYLQSIAWREHEFLFVINTGLGYIARSIGEQIFIESFQSQPKKRIVFVEEDYELFRHSMQLHNWDVNFWQPQVMWIVGVSISEIIEHPFLQQCPALFLQHPLFIHGGVLSTREVNDIESMEKRWKRERSLQSKSIAETFSNIQSRKHKFKAEDQKRVLFLSINQHTDLQKSIAHIFRSWHWECRFVSPKAHPKFGHYMYGFYQEWTWLEELKAFNADLIFLMNYIPPDPEVREALSKLDIPVIVWYVDDPKRDRDLSDRNEIDTSHYFIFCYDKTHIVYLKNKGYKNVAYLPVGTVMNLKRVKPQLFKAHDGVGYVGSLMTGESIMKDRVLRHSYPGWHEWLQDALSEIQRGVWKDEVDCLARKTYPVEEKLDYSVAITYLQDAVTNQMRISTLERMISYHLHTYGNRDLTPERCSNTFKQAYQGKRIDYHEELPALYAKTAVNLNLNHYQTKAGIAQRIYDCLAVGGFIITDSNPVIEETFADKEEIVCYRTQDELEDAVQYYMKHPEQRQKIIKSGREKVLQNDQLESRLQSMMKQVQQGLYE